MKQTEQASNAEAPKPRERGSRRAEGRPVRRRWWFRVFVYAFMGYVVWCTVLYMMQDWLLFPADVAATPRPRPAYPHTEILHLREGADDECLAWFVPAPDAGPDQPAPVVVFFHGNAETIDFHDDIVAGYTQRGISVLLPEYRGYGQARGRPGQEAIVSDATAFIETIMQRDDADPARLILHGRSLGGAVAAQVATRTDPAALILESTLRSVAEMAHGYGAPAFLAKHPFRTDRVLPTLDVPALVMHGKNDTIIPVDHGRDLARLARRGTYWEVDAGHNDFPGDANFSEYWRRIDAFLAASGIQPEEQP
jgi:hypothetical protein